MSLSCPSLSQYVWPQVETCHLPWPDVTPLSSFWPPLPGLPGRSWRVRAPARTSTLSPGRRLRVEAKPSMKTTLSVSSFFCLELGSPRRGWGRFFPRSKCYQQLRLFLLYPSAIWWETRNLSSRLVNSHILFVCHSVSDSLKILIIMNWEHESEIFPLHWA